MYSHHFQQLSFDQYAIQFNLLDRCYLKINNHRVENIRTPYCINNSDFDLLPGIRYEYYMDLIPSTLPRIALEDLEDVENEYFIMYFQTNQRGNCYITVNEQTEHNILSPYILNPTQFGMLVGEQYNIEIGIVNENGKDIQYFGVEI